MTDEREYYILAGDKGMKQLLIDKGINVSPSCLLIVSEKTKIGRLIKKRSQIELKKQISGEKK